MPKKIALVGTPNAGKSTLFKALTQREVAISPRPFTTIFPHRGMATLPDKRLDILAELENIPLKKYGQLEFIDVAGLIEGAHRGEGLGVEFLSHLQEADLLLFVLRNFKLNGLPPNPLEDFKTIVQEISLRDILVLERNQKKIKEKQLLEKLQDTLWEASKNVQSFLSLAPSPEQKEIIQRFGLLSFKEKMVLLNGFWEANNFPFSHFQLDAQIELELSSKPDLEKENLQELSKLENFLRTCYDKLRLITFFTIAHKKEARANLVQAGTTIKEASFLIHSEIGENLKGAEKIGWEEYLKVKSWEEAKKRGMIAKVSVKDKVKEGDIIEFKI